MHRKQVNNWVADAHRIICGELREKAAQGDIEARHILLQTVGPMQQAELLDLWQINPNDIGVDSLGDVQFA